MTGPGDVIINNIEQTFVVVDERNRAITIRRMTALDRLRLLKAAGPELSQNDTWLNMASLAMMVTDINGVPRVAPGNERQIEAAVAELGDEGLQAISDTLINSENADLFFDGSPSGNVAGTPT